MKLLTAFFVIALVVHPLASRAGPGYPLPTQRGAPDAAELTVPSRETTVSAPDPYPESAPVTAIGSAVVSGNATWYCGNGSPCSRGYGPSDMVAAIDPKLGIPKGKFVSVSHAGKTILVKIVDVCACGGARIIDLTSGAFRRLAPLSEGVIQVELELGTLPATDTE